LREVFFEYPQFGTKGKFAAGKLFPEGIQDWFRVGELFRQI
jgi:hypothetical protein